MTLNLCTTTMAQTNVTRTMRAVFHPSGMDEYLFSRMGMKFHITANNLPRCATKARFTTFHTSRIQIQENVNSSDYEIEMDKEHHSNLSSHSNQLNARNNSHECNLKKDLKDTMGSKIIENKEKSTYQSHNRHEINPSIQWLLSYLEASLTKQSNFQNLNQFSSLTLKEQVLLFYDAWSQMCDVFEERGIFLSPYTKGIIITQLNISKSRFDTIIKRIYSRRKRLVGEHTTISESHKKAIHKLVREFLDETHIKEQHPSIASLYTSVSKSTGLKRPIVRYIVQRLLESEIRIGSDEIKNAKQIITPIILQYKNKYDLTFSELLRRNKRDLYSNISESINIPRFQMREVVRGIIFKLIEDEVGAIDQKHRTAVIEILGKMNTGAVLSDYFQEIEDKTGLSKRQISRLVESLSSKQVTESDRLIVRESLEKYLSQFDTAPSQAIPDLSPLYSQIQERVTLNRIQIRRLVQQELLRRNRHSGNEARKFIREFIENNSHADPLELYSILQEKFSLTRDRSRELVHQERQKQLAVEITPEIRDAIHEVINQSRNIPSSELYSKIQNSFHIPRSQIRHIVRAAKNRKRSQQV